MLKSDPSGLKMTTPAWEAPSGSGTDCRTGQRLEHFNDLSTEIALAHGWSVIDYFTKTRPFVPDSIDSVHCEQAPPWAKKGLTACRSRWHTCHDPSRR